MSAKVLTTAAAKEANIDIIEDGRGTQAVHDVVVAIRAARVSGSANTKTKAEVDLMFSVQGQEAFGMFDGRPHDDVTAVGSRHRATYQNDFLRFAHLHDLKILHRYTSIAHVTRHTLIFPNAARRRAIADRADAPVRFRTVRRTLPSEIVLFHYALKTFAFRAANDIDEVAGLKLRNGQINFAFGKIAFQPKFAHQSLWLDSGLFKFAD